MSDSPADKPPVQLDAPRSAWASIQGMRRLTDFEKDKPFSEAEKKLIKELGLGEVVMIGPGKLPDKEKHYCEHEERVIRADLVFLRSAMMRGEARLPGARIGGDLVCSGPRTTFDWRSEAMQKEDETSNAVRRPARPQRMLDLSGTRVPARACALAGGITHICRVPDRELGRREGIHIAGKGRGRCGCAPVGGRSGRSSCRAH